MLALGANFSATFLSFGDKFKTQPILKQFFGCAAASTITDLRL